MKIFITGGTGFIGSRLTEKLLQLGHEVVVLIRDPSKVSEKKEEKISYIHGNLSDVDVLQKGMRDCDWVFHMAAYTKPWSKDPSVPFRINVTGTLNVIEAAVKNGVRRVIITSTAGTMGYSSDGMIISESTASGKNLQTLYEKSKAEAELRAFEYIGLGTEIVITNPSRIYGPGLLSESNSLTKIMKLYISGLWRLMPGDGRTVGNYVYIDDVTEGHILAALHGKNGERYILGGENLSFRDFFDKTGEAAGKKRKLFSISFNTAELFLKPAAIISRLSGKAPLITSEWINKYQNDAILSSEKAINELGYKITPFIDGVRETIKWLKSK